MRKQWPSSTKESGLGEINALETKETFLFCSCSSSSSSGGGSGSGSGRSSSSSRSSSCLPTPQLTFRVHLGIYH